MVAALAYLGQTPLTLSGSFVRGLRMRMQGVVYDIRRVVHVGVERCGYGSWVPSVAKGRGAGVERGVRQLVAYNRWHSPGIQGDHRIHKMRH